MKRHFVLDENIILLAEKGEDDRGNRDTTCLELIRAIAENCHALVLAEASWGRYSSQIRSIVRQRTLATPRVLSIIKSVVADLEKDTKYVSDADLTHIAGLEQLPGVDTGDAEFVRAAASVPGAILVTTDGPLRTTVTSQGIDRDYGFNILIPSDALAMAGPNG